MEKRLAILGIFVFDRQDSAAVNALLHEYGEHIIGRMGLPHPEEGCSVITIVMDAPTDAISAVSGKLGRLRHVQVKTMMASERKQ